MKTEFRKARVPQELRSLVAFDAKVFRASDRFDAPAWLECESWWMRIGARKIGCCAFQKHVDFQEDLREDRSNVRLENSLYIVTTGILPPFQRMGFGTLLKSWQISYARFHGFHRIVTNTRQRNHGMIALNEKFGFKVLRSSEGYYSSPSEATVVMELRLA
jgi:ribosomal protein S18 acetylase RimI-like enzyme